MNDSVCPQCRAVHIVNNGHAHSGKQRDLCRTCGLQFTLNPTWPRVSGEQIARVDRLRTERIAHRGICRVTGVSRSWFRRHLKALARIVPHQLDDTRPQTTKA